MTKASTIILLVISLFSISGVASDGLINMGPDFKTYINHYRNMDAKSRWRGWKGFEKHYQIYFDSVLCDSHDADCETAKEKLLEKFFQQLPQFEDSMWLIFQQAEDLRTQSIQRFKTLFPDVKEDTPVIFMPSLLSFNGLGGAKMNGRYVLVIGADLAALRKNDLQVLFSHEFFHIYQFDKMGSRPIYQTLASPLWFEGSAVWASLQLNPTASHTTILMNADLAILCGSDLTIAKMAADYLTVLALGYPSPEGKRVNSNWFNGNSHITPARQGYCLGFKAVSEIAKIHSLEEIVYADESQFTLWLNETLQELVRPQKNNSHGVLF